jgi:nucleotide-binding universal stress UspA family protein
MPDGGALRRVRYPLSGRAQPATIRAPKHPSSEPPKGITDMTDTINPLEVPPIERLDWPRHAPGEYPILVCVEFDETGHNALEQAIRLASTHGRASLHIAHIVDDTNPSGRGAVIERHTEELKGAQEQLASFVSERLSEHALETKLHVRIGRVVETVFQLALDYDVEMIVVGTHGRSGVARLAFGSVAQKLVEAARCPVLIACPRDYTGMSQTLIPDPPRPAGEAG